MRIAVALFALLAVGSPPEVRAQQPGEPTSDQIRSADALVVTGIRHVEAGEWEDALRAFDQALRQNPSKLTPTKTRAAEMLIERGVALLREQRHAAAIPHLDAAARMNLFNPLAPFFLAQAEYNLAIREFDRSRIDAARRLLQETERRDPNFGGSYYLWGLIGLSIRDYDAAVIGFEGSMERGYEARQSRANLAQALFFQGVKMSEDGRIPFDSVIPVFRRAIDLLESMKDDPGFPEEMRGNFRDLWIKSLVNAAAMHQKAGELTAAETILLRLVKIEPEDHLHWLNLGLFYGDSLKYDEALRHYQKALDVCTDPDWVEPYKMMGYIHSKRDEPEIAEKYFRAFLEKHPESYEGHFQFGSHLVGVGRGDEGAKHFERCVEIDPRKPAAIRELSLAFRRARRPVEADQWLTLFRLVEVPESEGARSDYPEGHEPGKDGGGKGE